MSDEQMIGMAETHIERMDRLEFEARQAKELAVLNAERDVRVAKERRKEARTEMLPWVAGILAVAAVLIACVYAFWIDDDPVTPESYKNTEAYREERCIDNGGGWVPADLLATSGEGLCVYPGKTATAPADK